MPEQNAETHKTTFLDRLPQAQSEALMKLSELRTYPGGTLLHSQGDRLPGIFVLSKGAIQLSRSTRTDKVQVIALAKPGGCIGEVQLLTDTPAVASSITVGETECWFIPADVWLRSINADPVVACTFLWHATDRIRRLVPLIETLSLHTVPERVAKLVLDAHEEEPGRNFVEFRDTQEGMAHYIGSSREAFNRGLKMLSDLGFVHNSYPVVHITDEPKLRRFAEGF